MIKHRKIENRKKSKKMKSWKISKIEKFQNMAVYTMDGANERRRASPTLGRVFMKFVLVHHIFI